eukprot:CAMPEP_0171202628 /NCGR_PEP_ID=MMETSP0790-20130122/25102_1 /TAXON_ID=2925 /ORGANISM="Alexandrium catenella, Strain OF101" /LENGTH=252 /DNA_ID=CAMNT_0011668061 /DNA_START=23 /DNA_END=780 /DNA_ORIENTATION=+
MSHPGLPDSTGLGPQSANTPQATAPGALQGRLLDHALLRGRQRRHDAGVRPRVGPALPLLLNALQLRLLLGVHAAADAHVHQVLAVMDVLGGVLVDAERHAVRNDVQAGGEEQHGLVAGVVLDVEARLDHVAVRQHGRARAAERLQADPRLARAASLGAARAGSAAADEGSPVMSKILWRWSMTPGQTQKQPVHHDSGAWQGACIKGTAHEPLSLAFKSPFTRMASVLEARRKRAVVKCGEARKKARAKNGL